jgi:hypothetical protein
MDTVNPLDARPGMSRQYVIGRGIFMTAAYAMLAIILVMFISGLLAGGQFGPTSDIKWDVILPWPAVWIPAWLVIAVCLLPPIGVLVLAPKARWEEAPDFLMFLAMTALLFILMPFGLSRMYPDAGGAVFNDRYPEFGMAHHWLGALAQIITLPILGIRMAILVPAYNAAVRRSRQGLS